ncbi:MAG: serine acetyltransferase [Acidimicrobiia bacterium]|nr:serine acetyltransferase [Acidimicrobiia bacterium]
MGALRRQVREDWLTNGRDWRSPGFRALFVNRFATTVRAKFTSRPARAPFALIYRAMFRHCRNVYGMKIDYTATIGRRLLIEHHMGIAVHPNARIGDDCVLRQNVTLGMLSRPNYSAAPVLGDRVDVGAGAQILGAIRVGDDAVVGANAVVVRDVPDGWAALGNPARIVRLRRSAAEAPRPSQTGESPS